MSMTLFADFFFGVDGRGNEFRHKDEYSDATRSHGDLVSGCRRRQPSLLSVIVKATFNFHTERVFSEERDPLLGKRLKRNRITQ